MPRYAPFDWYRTPLYYDIIFDADTAQEADFLADVHSLYGQSDGHRALEPACGSGRLMAAMAQRGYDVAGLDLEPGMLAFAEQRLQDAGFDARLVHAPMEDFALGETFDLAWCLVSSFKYLSSEAAAEAHLRLMADHLVPGGIYVLGLHLSDYDDPQADSERWVAERDGVKVRCTIRGWPPDPATRTEQVRARLVVEEADQTPRHYESRWTFRTYDLPQLQHLLSTEPRLEHVATYNFHHDIDQPIDFDGSWFDNVLILRRR